MPGTHSPIGKTDTELAITRGGAAIENIRAQKTSLCDISRKGHRAEAWGEQDVAGQNLENCGCGRGRGMLCGLM